MFLVQNSSDTVVTIGYNDTFDDTHHSHSNRNSLYLSYFCNQPAAGRRVDRHLPQVWDHVDAGDTLADPQRPRHGDGQEEEVSGEECSTIT